MATSNQELPGRRDGNLQGLEANGDESTVVPGKPDQGVDTVANFSKFHQLTVASEDSDSQFGGSFNGSLGEALTRSNSEIADLRKRAAAHLEIANVGARFGIPPGSPPDGLSRSSSQSSTTKATETEANWRFSKDRATRTRSANEHLLTELDKHMSSVSSGGVSNYKLETDNTNATAKWTALSEYGLNEQSNGPSSVEAAGEATARSVEDPENLSVRAREPESQVSDRRGGHGRHLCSLDAQGGGDEKGDAEGETEKDPVTLQRALLRERSSIYALRSQLSQLEEVTAMQSNTEAGTQAEMLRLRETNSRLELQVGMLQEMVDRMEGERKQLQRRLAALQRATQQLEREASIRARVQLDMAAATAPDASKRWLGWGYKDPVAEAAAVAENARVQKAAATATVEKLLRENADLAEQLNEQSGVIERLVRSYGDLAHQADQVSGQGPRAPATQLAQGQAEQVLDPEPAPTNPTKGGQGSRTDRTILNPGMEASRIGESEGFVSGGRAPDRGEMGHRGTMAEVSQNAGNGEPEGASRVARAHNLDAEVGFSGPDNDRLTLANSPACGAGEVGIQVQASSSQANGEVREQQSVRHSSENVVEQEEGVGYVFVPDSNPGSLVASQNPTSGQAASTAMEDFQNMVYAPREAIPGVRMGVVTSPKAPAATRSGGVHSGSSGRKAGGTHPSSSFTQVKATGLMRKRPFIIEAPIEFVSFLARFISGADLVKKNQFMEERGSALV